VYAGDWLQFSLLFPNPIGFTPTSYAFYSSWWGGPTTWALLGSNTGTTGSWSVLDSRPVSNYAGEINIRSYVISPAIGAAFTTFRLIALSIATANSCNFNLAQFRLVGTANGTVTPTLNTYALGFPISAYISSRFPTSSTSVSITSATPSSSNGAVLVGPLPSILAQYTQLSGWDWLDRCPPPEWSTFLNAHWIENKGVYTPVNGVKPPPRVGVYVPSIGSQQPASAGPSGGAE
jgi:hypothetical protein